MWIDYEGGECTCLTNDGYYDLPCPIHNKETYDQWKYQQTPEYKAWERKVIRACIKHAESLNW
jgi:hypothetical protein